LIDTAGLRKTSDSIEKEGVRRARERTADADFVLLMIDGGRAIDSDDREIFEEVKGKRKVIVINKNDLPLLVSQGEIEELFPGDPMVSISALNGEGLEALKETIYASLIKGEVRTSPEHRVIANIRHKVALGLAKDDLSNARKGLEEKHSLEFVAFEIRSALDALGEIIGETTTEEVLNRIFEKFCIGK
jgi:tRNA modification GTPase